MGKRKERRLAAMSNAGRRVKLDLFAEPSGDLGGSTVHDEVGVDTDSKPRPGLPNSPSSSGGFRSVSFLQKGLCRRDICAQHYIGGIMELLKKMFRLCCVLLLPPAQEFVFRL